MARPRDTQRARVYRAEDAAFDADKSEGLTVAECQAFADKVLVSTWVRKRYPRSKLPVKVTDGRGRRRAGYRPMGIHYTDQMMIPRWARSRWVVLHELAHHLTHRDDLAQRVPWHGWQFCECYLYLVRVFIGRWAEEALKEQFRIHSVKHRLPRKRQVSDAQRQVARQRMLALHERRKLAA